MADELKKEGAETGAAPDPSSGQGLSTVERTLIEQRVIDALRTCYDPEIPVNIYELGLIYDVRVDEQGSVTIAMTLTSPHCPAAQSLPGEVREKGQMVPGVKAVAVNVVWSPPWNPTMMSEAARLELGFM